MLVSPKKSKPKQKTPNPENILIPLYMLNTFHK